MKETICSFYQFDNMINIHFAFLDVNEKMPTFEKLAKLYRFAIISKILKNKQRKQLDSDMIKVIDQIDLTIKENDFFEQEEALANLAENVNQKLSELEMHGSRLSIGLAGTHFFYDSFTMPKLSKSAFDKVSITEINKIYTDFEKKYVYDLHAYPTNKKNVEVKFVACNKFIYQRILLFFKNIDCKLNKLFYTPVSLSQYALENRYLPRNINYFFLNVSKNYSNLIFINGKKESTISFVDFGYQYLLFRLHEEETDDTLKKYFKRLSDAISKIIGNNNSELTITPKLYVNIECVDASLIAERLQKELGCEVSQLADMNDYLKNNYSYIVFASTLNQKTNFMFPQRVKYEK